MPLHLFAMLACVAVVCCAGHFATAASAAPLELTIAPNGADTNPGTREQPLATLEAARDALRVLKQKGSLPPGGAVVALAAGDYHIQKSFTLTKEDSGTAAAPIVYQAAPGAIVRLLGGVVISDFGPVTDNAVRDRLDPAVRDKVVQCDLTRAGVHDIGELKSRGFGRPPQAAHLELFHDGRPMQLARWPNEGFAQIAGVPGKTNNDDHDGKLGDLKDGFIVSDAQLKKWKSPADIWIYGYWAWDWAATYERMESYDAATGIVKTAPPHGQYGFRTKQRIVFLNVLEELDQPGEYYADRASGLLYFYPPAPLKSMTKPESAVSTLAEPMISLRDVSFVTFRGPGLSLEYTRGHGLVITGGESCTIEDVNLRNIGSWGVRIEDGKQHRVHGCDVSQTGDGGVLARGGDRKTLTPGGHRIEDCRFTNNGRWSKCYVPAVQIGGVGQVLAHCEISQHPHAGVLYSGNEHTIEYNRIHHTCLETGDVGAIYIGRDWTMRGNRVQHNYFHDITGPGLHGAQAVYLDDQSSGSTMTGNIFVRVQRAVFIGGGRDNLVENNLFVDCPEGVAMDGRGLDSKPVWKNQTRLDLKMKLDEMNPDQPPYSTRYPQLATLKQYFADDAEGKGVPPEGNVAQRNLFVGVGKPLHCYWHATSDMLNAKDNTIARTPAEAGFENTTDPAMADYRLRPDAPALQAGFKPTPLATIGPRPQGKRNRD